MVEDTRLVYSVHEVAKKLRTSPNYVYDLINKDNFLIINEGNDLSDINNVKKLANFKEGESWWQELQYKKEAMFINISSK